MKRRAFITLPAKTVGMLLAYRVIGDPAPIEAQAGDIKVPLRFFTAVEARTVEAACERIFPSDDSGPGANVAARVPTSSRMALIDDVVGMQVRKKDCT